MKRKTSNILICVLAVIIVGCGVMAIGTFNGWFSGEEQTADKETVVTEETQGPQDEENAPEDEVQAAEQQEQQQNKQEEAQPQQQGQEQPKATEAARQCTITIKCDSILKHLDKLSEGKSKYVPSNGVILSKSTINFKEGSTVYDVLNATCNAAGINLSARKSSMGIYVEGINNIFEFDCGKTSGWMYSVNGSSPNHSCSEHKVSNGDSIVWYYTCGN